MEKNILDFWKLCELSNFERFSLQKELIESLKLSQVKHSKSIKDEYAQWKNKEYKLYINNKTTNIYKIYLGILKSDEMIKYIYHIFKSNHILKEEIDVSITNDLEKLKSSEYTYMAYVYLDSNLNLMAINNNVITINPLFYIVYNILKKKKIDNHDFTNFLEEYNQKLKGDYRVEQSSKIVIIPELNYLLNIGKYPNPFQYLHLKSNYEIIIFSETLKQIKELDSSNKILQALEENKNNTVKILEIDCSEEQTYEEYLLESAIKLSKKQPYDFVYLQTKEKIKDKDISIPSNLYLTTFLKKEQFYLPAITSTQSPIDEKILNEIFLNIQEYFSISDTVFYKEKNNKLFIKTLKDIKITTIEQKMETPLVSFYIDALEEIPKKLTLPYIRGKEDKEDVNSNSVIRKSINDLNKFKETHTRWVSPYPLNYAQQASVNLFVSNLNKVNNIFTVNGPPGSGKTTLLKDVIANIITKKIIECIKIDKKLFDNNGNFHQDLCGKYEIMVTSNNNGAVENITLELPKEEEFSFDYLQSDKTEFLLRKYAKNFYNFPSWNFISARLGNKSNVHNFVTNLEETIKEIKNDNSLNQTFLNERYDTLLSEFHSTLLNIKTDEALFESFSEMDDISNQLKTTNEIVESLKSELQRLKQNYIKRKHELETLLDTIEDNERQINIIRERKELKNKQLKALGFFNKLFGSEASKKLKSAKQTILIQLNDNLETLQKCELQKSKLLSQQKEGKKIYDTKENEYNEKLNEFNTLQIKYKKLKNLYDNKDYEVNDERFYTSDEEKLQKSSLYNKESYLKNKALLFKISMQVNEVLFLLNMDNFVKSTTYYLKNYSKKNLNSKEQEKLQNSFSALFFLFPVISTTLASSHTMLKNIKEYGVLLCDESGQATPQSLVGMLNRANNALIVGDPLQVEPVFTAPDILIKLLEQIYNIDTLHSPLTSSVQQLADNTNKYGSFYEINHEKIWVGMPLVVHRRCINPMFNIANSISYNDKMVLATLQPKEDDYIHNLPESCWLDVVSMQGDFDENSSKKEKELFERFLKEHKAYLKDNYYIISPFKSIYKLFEKNNTIGTVHTFQGKEADVVFFILGGSSSGSKAWASSKANLLNVAVTRAKKRVYIIGDYKEWSQHSYFNIATQLLPRKREIPLSED